MRGAAAGLAGLLSLPTLAALVAVFGLLSLVNDAAHQSFLPRLLPREALTRANARLSQSSAAADTAGPAVAGGLVGWLGAPAAVLVDAATYLTSGLLIARVRARSTRPRRPAPRSAGRSARASPGCTGTGCCARCRCARTAGSSSTRRSARSTSRTGCCSLGFSAFGLGLTLALAGVGGLAGAGLSERAGRPGLTIPLAWVLQAAGIAIIALTPVGSLLVAGLGNLVNGFGLGLSSPLELAYRQTITPDRLQARTNATMRSINRAAVVVGAPLGGLLADSLGYRPALWLCAGGVAAAGLALLASPFRTVR